ncbi:MAG: sugar transferase [Acidimicrobiales bacterium]
MVVHARATATPYDPFTTFRFPWTVIFLTVFLVTAYGLGLPDIPLTRIGAVGSAFAAVAASVLFVSVSQLVLGVPLLPRLVVGPTSVALLPWALMCWQFNSDVDSRASTRVFVTARPDEVAELRGDLTGPSERPAEIVGWLDPTESTNSGFTSSDCLTEAFATSSADLLIMDLAGQANPEIVKQAAALHRTGVRVRTLSLFSEEYLGKIPLTEMERMSLLFDIGEVHRLRYVRTKRVFDIAFASVGLAALLLLIPIVALTNLRFNRGPVFYTQIRVGKDGKDFRIYKFRSMIPVAASSSTVQPWTKSGDVRITRFGGFLRISHLDELPQVINIMRGDLSIVGPRPEQRQYVEQLEAKLPYYEVRHMVRPGLTGWAQIKFGYAADSNDAREKLQYDLYYLRRQSLPLDLRIVVRTLRAVLLRSGR